MFVWSKQFCEIFLFLKKKIITIINWISTYLKYLMRPAQGSSTIKSLAMHSSRFFLVVIIEL